MLKATCHNASGLMAKTTHEQNSRKFAGGGQDPGFRGGWIVPIYECSKDPSEKTSGLNSFRQEG